MTSIIHHTSSNILNQWPIIHHKPPPFIHHQAYAVQSPWPMIYITLSTFHKHKYTIHRRWLTYTTHHTRPNFHKVISTVHETSPIIVHQTKTPILHAPSSITQWSVIHDTSPKSIIIRPSYITTKIAQHQSHITYDPSSIYSSTFVTISSIAHYPSSLTIICHTSTWFITHSPRYVN